MEFDLAHNEAFESLGARSASQHWSSFDVSRQEARNGHASKFVTTIWNWHSKQDADGRRVPTELAICTDAGGSFWYRMSPPVAGSARPTHAAHWSGLQLAIRSRIPIIGILKDVNTGRCASQGVFDIDDWRTEEGGEAVWLCLLPRYTSDFLTRPLTANDKLSFTGNMESLDQLEANFIISVQASSQLGSAERQSRLRSMSVVPERVKVTTYAFRRNPHVVTERLILAAGKCEDCKAPAPFIRRSDSTPYLEVHHRVPLANGGEDTVENAIALCPNCHRKRHYA